MSKEYIEKAEAINAIEDTSCYLCKKYIRTKKCDCDCEIWRNKKMIHNIPAVPQEMSAREYERTLDRAFRSDDDAYGEWADAIDEGNKDKAVTIIEEWAREHP